jgi:thiosulfate reductase cytochrome b subunit
MARRPLQWYLHKANRISGYVLFAIIPLFIISGLAMTGEYGLHKLLSADSGWKMHYVMRWPVVGFFVIHSAISWYFSFQRWGWVK